MSESSEPLLSARGVHKHFPVRAGFLGKPHAWVRAVDGVDLDISEGETVGLVGESGCGKSTLGRLLVDLSSPTAGEIRFGDLQLGHQSRHRQRELRRRAQIVFQDPVGSLDPRMTVGQTVGEGLEIHRLGTRAERRKRVIEILERVGLGEECIDRFPHEFSGGQRQRVGIARALVLEPHFLVLDEPVSALDVSVQSQVINLLTSLKRDLGLTYLFIAHNLAVVSYVSDRVAVMYLGKIVEMASARQIYQNPAHPYTKALLSAVPEVKPGSEMQPMILEGDVPNPADPPSGCRFRTRCPIAADICAREEPPLLETEPGHVAACHFAGKDIPTIASAQSG